MQNNKSVYPTILTIAASDCIGGAGIQADLKVAARLRVYAVSAVTAITAQNSCGVTDTRPVDSKLFEAQLKAIIEDLRPDAVKIGLIPNEDIAMTVARFLNTFKLSNVVLDPVMAPTLGKNFYSQDMAEVIAHTLIPVVSLVTPNTNEYHKLLTSDSSNSLKQTPVLLKGGHNTGPLCEDLLYLPDQQNPLSFKSPRIETPNSHGTGCVLSSAIACYLAKGHPMPEAVKRAKKFLFNALQASRSIKFGVCGYGPTLF